MGLCDKNSVDSLNNGPFYFICNLQSEAEALEIFEYLTEVGVNMNILNQEGSHPLTTPDKIYRMHHLLFEKYFENEENRNFKFLVGVEDILRAKGKMVFAEMLGKQKENTSKRMKLTIMPDP